MDHTVWSILLVYYIQYIPLLDENGGKWLLSLKFFDNFFQNYGIFHVSFKKSVNSK